MTPDGARPRGFIALALMLIAGGCVPAVAGDAGVAAPAPTGIPAAPPPVAGPADFVLRGNAIQGGTLIGQVPGGTRALTFDGQPVAVAPDGAFLVAFDRDAPATQRLVATLDGGRTVERVLAIAAGTWRIEPVNAPYRGGAATDAEFARRRPAELEQIAAARAVPVVSEGWRQPFRWPVTGRLSGLFGSQRVYQGKPGSYHGGTDVAAPTGTPFVAPADGIVTLAAATPFTLEGHLLIVDHGMGLSSSFLHCQTLDVKIGDRVVQGQVLGTVGATGRATGPHLHWGLRWRDARLDPGTLAGPMGR